MKCSTVRWDEMRWDEMSLEGAVSFKNLQHSLDCHGEPELKPIQWDYLLQWTSLVMAKGQIWLYTQYHPFTYQINVRTSIYQIWTEYFMFNSTGWYLTPLSALHGEYKFRFIGRLFFRWTQRCFTDSTIETYKKGSNKAYKTYKNMVMA